VISILFSFRGRITRAESWLIVLAWLVLLTVGAFAARLAMGFGHQWAGWIYAGLALSALVGLQSVASQRAHDVGLGYWSALFGPFTLLRRGTAGPNTFGAAPPRGRVWWLLGAIVLLGLAVYTAAAFGIERFAASYCTPYVSASAATKDDAELRWKEIVSATHGTDYVTGITVGHRNVCRNGECTVSARACRRS